MPRLAAALVAMLAIPTLALAQITVTSGTLLEQASAAGTEYLTQLVLHNPTSTARVARLTPTDYEPPPDGRSETGSPGHHARSNAQWLHDIPATVTVPPGTSANVTVRVVVPADGSLIGTYWSAILVETVEDAEPVLRTATGATRPSLGITMRVLYAVQIATHVGDAATARLGFAAVRSSIDSTGHPVLDLDFLNPGQRGLRPEIIIELYDIAGDLVSRQKQQRGLLYPGGTLQQHFRFDGLKRGEYTALVLADAGGSEVFGVQLVLRY